MDSIVALSLVYWRLLSQRDGAVRITLPMGRVCSVAEGLLTTHIMLLADCVDYAIGWGEVLLKARPIPPRSCPAQPCQDMEYGPFQCPRSRRLEAHGQQELAFRRGSLLSS